MWHAELGQTERNEKVKQLSEKYKELKQKATVEGFNSNVFDALIPQVRISVVRNGITQQMQIWELVKCKGAFTSNGVVLNVGTMVVTSNEVLIYN
eukprot:scaffold29686_cov75-Attheya_sp.AAC.1